MKIEKREFKEADYSELEYELGVYRLTVFLLMGLIIGFGIGLLVSGEIFEEYLTIIFQK